VHNTWELIQASGSASPGLPHALRVGLLTFAIVLAIVTCWILIALTAQPPTHLGPAFPAPGLDL
jgi:hypothetical protein